MAENVNELHQDSLTWHERLAVKITGFIGTMLCAVLFSVIAFVSLPAALATKSVVIIIGWLAQTFLQLVLLSIIMVGQNLQQRHAEFLAEETYKTARRNESETEGLFTELDVIKRLLNVKK